VPGPLQKNTEAPRICSAFSREGGTSQLGPPPQPATIQCILRAGPQAQLLRCVTFTFVGWLADLAGWPGWLQLATLPQHACLAVESHPGGGGWQAAVALCHGSLVCAWLGARSPSDPCPCCPGRFEDRRTRRTKCWSVLTWQTSGRCNWLWLLLLRGPVWGRKPPRGLCSGPATSMRWPTTCCLPSAAGLLLVELTI
jgi:hypothetical protein